MVLLSFFRKDFITKDVVNAMKIILLGTFKGFLMHIQQLLNMHEKSFENVQQKYFHSIYKCAVVFKLKIFNFEMFSKNALLNVQTLS